MRRILLIVGLVILLVSGIVFAIPDKQNAITADKKILIAYYSHSGNTKSLAKMIQTQTGGDLFEIQTKAKYPDDYTKMTEQAKSEIQKGYKPALVNNGDVRGYNVIFIGTPVWWGTLSNPVKSFISANDFSGKIIIPFCTHGGGGAANTFNDMKKLAPDAKFGNGFSSIGNSASSSDIKEWINKAL